MIDVELTFIEGRLDADSLDTDIMEDDCRALIEEVKEAWKRNAKLKKEIEDLIKLCSKYRRECGYGEGSMGAL